MKLITISGVDGSGKSTQVKMLKEHLESQGKRVFYFHAIEFGMAKKINDLRLKYCLICRYLNSCRKDTSQKSVTKANFMQIIMRRIFLIVDILRFNSLSKKLSVKGFDYILSDRYFYDSVININYLSRKNKTLPCEKFIQIPDKSFYLEIDPELIMQRERKPDQGVDYLRQKSALFRNKIEMWNMEALDASRDKNTIFNEIIAKIQAL